MTVERDSEPVNPREDCDNFGKMVCWHARYQLGDGHHYQNPEELLKSIVIDNGDRAMLRGIVADTHAGKYDDLRLNYDRDSGKWQLESYLPDTQKWYREASFPAPLTGCYEDVADSVLDLLDTARLQELAKDAAVILPVYLYDHSGLAISTTSFSDRWDSGQLGCIYATHEDIKRTYGSVTPETIEQAQNLLRGEVSEYDHYLNGECYGFTLYKNGRETDRCGGFLGELSDVLGDMRSYLPAGREDMLDRLKEQERPSLRLALKAARKSPLPETRRFVAEKKDRPQEMAL